MPPLQRMPPSLSQFATLPASNIKEDAAGKKYPQFLEGKYNMKSQFFSYLLRNIFVL